ncbi:hypothetical protein G6F60_014400 [Rhizopus arrhizus]|nr:hypothetical protein G6F60_014400 [Rhizopus arrhizus]
MEQRDREEVLLLLANRSCNVLVASDVAARGLDVEELAAVINYELPTDVESYQHRVGRTGRAGASGLAISLVAGREKTRAEAIEAQMGGNAHAAHRWWQDRQAAPGRYPRRTDR